MNKNTIAILTAAALLLSLQSTRADSATWNLNPTTGDWNTAANWTPATVPDGPGDVATFGSSNQTSIIFSAAAEVSSVTFQPGASAFTITTPLKNILTFSGDGITNNSGITQHFVVDQDESGILGGFHFINAATAGSATEFTLVGGINFYGYGGRILFYGTARADHASFDIHGAEFSGLSGGEVWFTETSTAEDANFLLHGGGRLNFYGSSTAGNAAIVNNGGAVDAATSANLGNSTIVSNAGVRDGQGAIFVQDNASAGHAKITNNGGTFDGDYGPYTDFSDTATADTATVISNGGTASGAGGGLVGFNYGTPTAANATLIANGGINGGSGGFVGFGTNNPGTPTAGDATLIANGSTNGGTGGVIQFGQTSDGARARVELFGDGSLNIASHSAPGLTIGSLEGNGLVLLGSNNLTIGSSNASTTFAGVIQDEGIGGSLWKIGTGTLTLSGTNTYTGPTTIQSGTLLVTTRSGSGTGSAGVKVNAGTLGGTGRIGGGVTVGSRTGSGAVLAPGINGPGSLTVDRMLLFNPDGIYKFEFNSNTARADRVTANGVTLDRRPLFSFIGLGSGTLAVGTVFTSINNTAGTPISGTFRNLADGSTVTVGSNTFQANYEGGDGNDLTLTVVP